MFLPRSGITAVLLSATALLVACTFSERPPPDSAPPPVSDVPGDSIALERTLTPEGLGVLRAGMSVEEAARVVPGTLTMAAGANRAECQYAIWTGGPAGVRIMLENGIVARIEVKERSIRTSAGAAVGDSRARIDSLYPGRVRRNPHKYVPGWEYLIVLAEPPSDTLFRLVFETDSVRVTEMRSGKFPAVEYVEGCL